MEGSESLSNNVVMFPSHKIHSKCNNVGCIICNMGVKHCDTCECGEGGLATHCPQQRINWEIEERIIGGYLDFFNGKWHVLVPNKKRG